MKGWKVFREKEGLYSACADIGLGGIRYEPGKRNFPREGAGSLGVFARKRDAIAFKVLVEGLDEHAPSVIRKVQFQRAETTREGFWYPHGRRRTVNNCDIPEGTVFAMWVQIDI